MNNLNCISQVFSAGSTLSSDTERRADARERHVAVAAKDDIDFSGLPGTIQTFRTIEYARSCSTRLGASHAIGDTEGEADAIYRMAQLPFTLIGSISATIAFLKNFSFAEGFRWVVAAFKASIIFALICSAFETLYDAYWIFRETKLLNRPEMAILRLAKEEPDIKKMEAVFDKHQKYFQRLLPQEEIAKTAAALKRCKMSGYLYFEDVQRAQASLTALAQRCLQMKYFTEGDEGQHAKMKRRIRPWCYEIVKQELQPAIRLLESTYKENRTVGLKKAEGILELVEAQAEKKRLNHILGIAYTILTFAALITTSIACPYIVPLLLLVVSYIAAVAQWGVYAGALDNRGWTFTLSTCVPEPLRGLRNKIANCFKPAIEQQPALHKNSQPAWEPSQKLVEGDRKCLPSAQAVCVRV